MDSRSDIGGEPSRRKTRSWHPGSQDRASRRPAPKSRSKQANGRSGFGTDAHYWGRINTQGEFEQASNFPAPPYKFHFPWSALFATIRRILPLAAAAFVGAATALAWQSFLVGPTRVSADVPIVRSSAPVPAPVPAPAPPVPAQPVHQALLGAAPSPSQPPELPEAERSQAVRPVGLRALLTRPRSPVVPVQKNRAPKPAVSTAHKWQAGDPDAVLQPSFF